VLLDLAASVAAAGRPTPATIAFPRTSYNFIRDLVAPFAAKPPARGTAAAIPSREQWQRRSAPRQPDHASNSFLGEKLR
jgi:hypothetical protein